MKGDKRRSIMGQAGRTEEDIGQIVNNIMKTECEFVSIYRKLHTL